MFIYQRVLRPSKRYCFFAKGWQNNQTIQLGLPIWMLFRTISGGICNAKLYLVKGFDDPLGRSWVMANDQLNKSHHCEGHLSLWNWFKNVISHCDGSSTSKHLFYGEKFKFEDSISVTRKIHKCWRWLSWNSSDYKYDAMCEYHDDGYFSNHYQKTRKW